MAAALSNNGGESPNLPPALAEKPIGLPPGKYKLVGWDIVATGRRLIDEICHIAAFTPPHKKYAQFVMPFGDLNPGARRRNHLRVVTVGRYRMLKDTVTQKVVKTKSEVTALVDFMNWLESQKKDYEMIILIYHEPRRLHPKVLLERLIRHKFLPRFQTIVAGFTDSYSLCYDKCMGTVKSVSLHLLATLLLDKDSQCVDSAVDRAIATYKIVEQLANQDGDRLDFAAGGEYLGSSPSSEMMALVLEYARPLDNELSELESFKILLERQNTFHVVMRPLLRSARPRRRRVTQLRRILAEAGLVFYQFKDAWHEGRRAGLERLISPLEETVKAEDIKELLDIFVTHFEQEARRPPSTDNYEDAGDETSDFVYFSGDSDSSDQLSSAFSMSGMASAILMCEEDNF